MILHMYLNPGQAKNNAINGKLIDLIPTRYLLFRNTLRIYYFTRFVFTLSHAPQLQGKIFVGIQKYFRVSPLQSFDLCSLSTMQ